MKSCIILFLTITLVACSGLKRTVLKENQLEELKTAYENKHYFNLRDTLKRYDDLSSVMLSYYRGLVDNKFNRLESSIKHLQTFIRHMDVETDADKLIDCWKTLGDDYTKTFRYKDAAEAYQTILDEFGDRLDTEQKKDMENYVSIFSALTDVPPQTVVIEEDMKIELLDGGYIPLRVNGQDMRLGLDTGANYSFIMRSIAEKVNMRIIDADVNVDNVAGQIVLADLGVAAELEIEHTVLQNVIFLVFDDKDLYFEQADFQVIGAIGFPAASSLKEITFHQTDTLFIPATPRAFAHQNLCLDDLTPVIAGFYRGHRHAFCLDTGAGQSVLYLPFFQEYEKQLKAQYVLKSNRQQGLGGFRDIPAYIMKDAVLSFAGKEAVFHDLPVLTDVTTDDSEYFYGNIGRDLLHQFDTMTINFESMVVVFE